MIRLKRLNKEFGNGLWKCPKRQVKGLVLVNNDHLRGEQVILQV